MNTPGSDSPSQALEKLKEEGKFFRAIAETAHDMIYVIGPDNYVKYVNPIAAIQFNTSAEKVIDKSIADLFPPDIAPRQEKSLKQVLDTGQEISNDSLVRFGDRQVWLNNRLEPLCDESGKVIAVLGISRDITQRKQAEEALKESEEKYRKLVDLTPDGIAIYSEDKVVFVNPSAIRIAGVNSAEELVGKPIWDFIHPDFREIIKQRYEQMLQTNLPVPVIEQKWVRPDGQIIDVEVEAFPISLYGKTAVQFVFHDVTGRKKAEKALKESEERYRKLVDLTPDGIAIHIEGKVVFANSAAAKILDAKSVSELIGKSALDVVHPDFREIVKKRVQQLTQAGQEAPLIEEKWISLTGRPIDVEAAAIPFISGGKTAVQVVFHDITSHKKLEAEIVERAESLEKMNKLMIGRELKMIEMKKELEELRNQVSK